MKTYSGKVVQLAEKKPNTKETKNPMQKGNTGQELCCVLGQGRRAHHDRNARNGRGKTSGKKAEVPSNRRGGHREGKRDIPYKL